MTPLFIPQMKELRCVALQGGTVVLESTRMHRVKEWRSWCVVEEREAAASDGASKRIKPGLSVNATGISLASLRSLKRQDIYQYSTCNKVCSTICSVEEIDVLTLLTVYSL